MAATMTSRRVTSDPVVPDAALSRWDAAEADYVQIRDRWHLEMDRFAAVAQRYFATPRQATEEDYAAAEAEEGRHCSLDSEAMDRLNATPAPHFRAVLLKLELIEKFSLPMEAVIADVRRLTGEA